MYSEYDEQRKERVADQQARDLRKRLRKRRNKTIRRVLLVLIVALFIPARNFLRDTGIPAAKCFLAETRLKDGQYDRARELYLSAGEYKDAPEKAVTCMVLKGDSLMEAGSFMAAYDAYEQAGQAAEEKRVDAALKSAQAAREQGHGTLAACYLGMAGRDAEGALTAGSSYTFGVYEQDNDPENGPEPIQWRVLAIEDGTLLLMSEYLLDCMAYEPGRQHAVTWEKSAARKWLNGDFIEAAFTEEERDMLVENLLENFSNRKSGTAGGVNTRDRVYFLSEKELLNYLPTAKSRRAYNTAYSIAKGAYNSIAGYGWWWLRSPGRNSGYVMRVYYNGEYSMNGIFAGVEEESIRPVIRLDLAKLP